MYEVEEKAKRAFLTKVKLGELNTEIKNSVLNLMAEALIKNKEKILEENKKDLVKGEEKGLSKSLLDRLLLNENRIFSMVQGIKDVVSLPDPVGEIVEGTTRPNGLLIIKKRVPLGVIGMIYEARPNVTVDAITLCLKSGNAIILRGGSEAFNSNLILYKILSEVAYKNGIPNGAIQMIENTDRKEVEIMFNLIDYIDVIIPRGSKTFIDFVKRNSRVPVIETGAGVVHIYIDKDFDLEMAKKIVVNAKVQKPSVCNAVEKLLFHKDVSKEAIIEILDELRKNNVEIIGDKFIYSIYKESKLATEEDWDTEYLDLKITVGIVEDIDEAIEHINKHSTHHSETIISRNYENIIKFLNLVDSACVYANASTRFSDGGEFGLGAEIGISTQKLHTRGPMGLRELTSIKYIIFGSGQIRK
ncbi:MAG: glutamate-5-semialdehyde dehydrogenase [Caldisericia bacterium]|jgi:glutamate-5-semialdehyde dehydrogenase|nr:glutamate-5-semialdehyde dehydrogenase [Caldisericia bacterium]